MDSNEQSKQPEAVKKPTYLAWLREYGNLLFYFVAGLFFVWGQVKIFSNEIQSGIVFTAVSALVLLLTLFEKHWLKIVSSKTIVVVTVLAELWQKWMEKKAAPKQKKPEDAPEVVADIVPQPVAEAPKEENAFFKKLNDIKIRIPRWLIVSLGAVFIVGSQPLLMKENVIAAIFVFVVGGLLVFGGVKFGSLGWQLCTLLQLIKGLFVCFPALVLLGIGNTILVTRIHTSAMTDALGLGLNAAGILLLFSLYPRVFPDPENTEGRLLDAHGGEAPTKWIFMAKIGLAVVGYVFIQLFQNSYSVGQFDTALIWGLLGVGALGFSFPLAMLSTKAPEDRNPIFVFLVNVFRLSAFAFGLYAAYQGQLLIKQEMFYPGLAKYGIAALCMLLAFREPNPKQEDKLQEKPLKWYWELLLLVAILGVAAWLRIRLIEIMPYGIECDEAGGTVNALEMRENFKSLVAHPAGAPLFTLLPRLVSTAFFGIGNLGVKADAIFFGVVGIFAMYLLSRMFWGPRIALGVAALMALSRWHLHFSRFGFTNTFFITLLIIAFYFLIKGLQSRKKLYFLMSGMGMAFVVQSETAGRLMPLIAIMLMLYFAYSQKRFFQRNWKPILAIVLGAWLTGAGIFIFFGKHNHILLKRVQEVSVYSGDVNAPRQVGKGLIDNIRVSLGMLNHHGDYRTRHNGGMSGEPVLDFWTSIMFLLGFLYTMYYWRRWRYGIMLMWFFGFMAASIFSIEAPQSHRAFGLYPAAFLMIGAFLDRSRRLLVESLGKLGWLVGVVLFVLLLIPISKTNFHKYFDTIPAFDTNCTSSARYVGSFDPEEWETVFMSAYFWQGHPPFHLYARNISGRFYYYANTAMPYRLPEIKGLVYALVLEYPPLLPTIQWFYPNGEFTEEKHDKYGLIYQGWAVPKEEVARTRGLTATYWNNSQWAGQPALVQKDADLTQTFDGTEWPLEGPGSVEWEGTLWIPHEGNYTFYLYGHDFVEVSIGKKYRLQTDSKQEKTRTIYLPAGLHRFRARAQHQTENGRILFAWSSTESITYFLYKMPHKQAFFKQPFPHNYYFTYPESVGLLETYYQTPDWTGKIAAEQIQPALCYFSGFSNAFRSIEWKGYLTIEEPGDYRFELTCNEFAELLIDGQHVFSRGTHPAGVARPNSVKQSVYLSKGRHRFEGRMSSRGGGYKLWWTPPGKGRELVPAWVLSPKEK
jgi:PA14 domain-containing protein/dolichyl-phosphate-mannose-protein mannosyltransferase